MAVVTGKQVGGQNIRRLISTGQKRTSRTRKQSVGVENVLSSDTRQVTWHEPAEKALAIKPLSLTAPTSDVNKDLGPKVKAKDLIPKAKAKAKDLAPEVKAKAKDLMPKVKAKAKDLTLKAKPKVKGKAKAKAKAKDFVPEATDPHQA